MKDIDVTVAPPPAAAEPEPGAPKRRALSRRQAKSIERLICVTAEQTFSTRERLHRETHEELQSVRRQLACYKSLLEACVRRYGNPLVFNFDVVARECAQGRVKVTARPDLGRITVEHSQLTVEVDNTVTTELDTVD